MNNIYAVTNGKVRKASDVQFADHIVEMRANKDKWDVIGELVDAWAKRTPDDFKAFKVQMDDLRGGLYDRKFGVTAGGKQQERRLTMVFPESLFFMIRSVYKSDELPMDRKFYQEFLRRFPLFKVPEKI